jgi:hypothetical protein
LGRGSHIYAWVDLDCHPAIFQHSRDDRHPPPHSDCGLKWGLPNFLPWLASNRDHPNLCFLSSYNPSLDYRQEPLCPTLMWPIACEL